MSGLPRSGRRREAIFIAAAGGVASSRRWRSRLRRGLSLAKMAEGPLELARPNRGASVQAGAASLVGRFLAAGPVVLVACALIAVLASGVMGHVSWDELRARRLVLKAFVARHPVESFVAYIGVYGAMVALSLPGALIMTVAGGVLFGAVIGSAGAVLAVSGGSLAMFLAAHTALATFFRRQVGLGGLLETVETGIRRHAFHYILFLRLMPAAPIWLVNVCAGLVRAPVGVFTVATLIGVTPSTAIYASLGSDLDHALSTGRAPRLDAALQPSVWLPLVCLAFLALLPVAMDRWRRRF